MISIKTTTIALVITTSIIQQVAFGYNFFDDEDETDYILPCSINPIRELSSKCDLLKFYNQAEVNALILNNSLTNVSEECACELANMQDLWTEAFDDEPATRRLSEMVKRNIDRNSSMIKHPSYLWSDLDVTAYEISIYTSTKDFFDKQTLNSSISVSRQLRKTLEKDEVWTNIRRVCRKIARDRFHLYRYLENLNRINSQVFFKLVSHTEAIEIVYQASKACKILLVPKFTHYKLRPDNSESVAAEASLEAYQFESSNLIENDIDNMLKYSSLNLLQCKSFQTEESSIQKLNQSCPMMMNEKISTDWIIQHPDLTKRSMIAIKCGCQLLLHNSTWEVIMRDPNVQLMSRSLTNYMNLNRPPDFVTTPVWAIYGWFQDTMDKFIQNRDMSVQEVIKTKMGNQDPSSPTHGQKENALELLRRGCNFIMFNYKKGSKEAIELKLVKYLDNLQQISRDPMFVFHLTLQEPNLFKLHALSKMCEPIVK